MDCVCGREGDIDPTLEEDPFNCNLKCNGGENDHCGGQWKMAVYRILGIFNILEENHGSKKT